MSQLNLTVTDLLIESQFLIHDVTNKSNINQLQKNMLDKAV